MFERVFVLPEEGFLAMIAILMILLVEIIL